MTEELREQFEDRKWRNLAEDEIGEGGTHFLYFVAGYRCAESEYKPLFDLQQTRMEEATKIWQKETGNDNALPDLGALLTWILDALRAAEKRAEEREDYARVITNDLNEQRSRVVRLEADNTRLRDALKTILNISNAQQMKDPSTDGDTIALFDIQCECEKALLPSGNKDPRPDEIDPIGTDFGSFKEKREFPS